MSGDLEHIEVRSGVNGSGKAFCTVVVNGGDLLGQLTPDDVRTMALHWLGAAEAAEQDAIVFRLLTSRFDLDTATAGAFIAAMRDERDQ